MVGRVIDINLEDTGTEWRLYSGVAIGYEGENLVTEIRFHIPDYNKDDSYRVEINDGNFYLLNNLDDYAYLYISAEMNLSEDFDIQLVGCHAVDEETIKVKKSNTVQWRTLDSVNASKECEAKYPEVLDEILAKLQNIGEVTAGKDGYSPTFEATPVEDGYKITVTSKDGEEIVTDVFYLKNGINGKDGRDGVDGVNGQDGQNGQDGFSPTVSTTETETGTAVVITDSTGDHTFTVKNGTNGQNGQDGRDGVNGSDYVITEADYNAIAEVVLGKLPDGDTMAF